jgi:hypothetical protein
MSRELKPWDDRDSPPGFPRWATAHQFGRQIKAQPPPQSRCETVAKYAPEFSEIAHESFLLPLRSRLRAWTQVAVNEKAPITPLAGFGVTTEGLYQGVGVTCLFLVG